MSEFNFDARVDRARTGAIKWTRHGPDDSDKVLPFWVADMDFELAPPITRALQERLAHGILGYSEPTRRLDEAFLEWLDQQYGWQAHPDWLVWVPGIVPGFNLACASLPNPGQSVMMNTPVYYPFLETPKNMGHKPIYAPLIQAGERFEMDLERMQADLAADTRMFLACNPQNPTGRAYTREELNALADFCLGKDLIICSDEIHAPLVLDPAMRHHTIAKVVPEIESRLITLFAPSKTWNFAGLGCGVAVIPNKQLRSRYKSAHSGLIPMMNPLSMVAAEAAYRHGEPWRQSLLEYLRGNHDLLFKRVNALPGIEMKRVEATYLAWINVASLGLDSPAAWLRSFGIALSEGSQFKGPGYVRFNFGCPRSMLEEGIKRFEAGIAAALNSLASAPDSL